MVRLVLRTRTRVPGVKSKSHAQRRRSEEHTSELQSHSDLVCRLLLEKKKKHQQLLAASLHERASRTALRTSVRYRPVSPPANARSQREHGCNCHAKHVPRLSRNLTS